MRLAFRILRAHRQINPLVLNLKYNVYPGSFKRSFGDFSFLLSKTHLLIIVIAS